MNDRNNSALPILEVPLMTSDEKKQADESQQVVESKAEVVIKFSRAPAPPTEKSHKETSQASCVSIRTCGALCCCVVCTMVGGGLGAAIMQSAKGAFGALMGPIGFFTGRYCFARCDSNQTTEKAASECRGFSK